MQEKKGLAIHYVCNIGGPFSTFSSELLQTDSNNKLSVITLTYIGKNTRLRCSLYIAHPEFLQNFSSDIHPISMMFQFLISLITIVLLSQIMKVTRVGERFKNAHNDHFVFGFFCARVHSLIYRLMLYFSLVIVNSSTKVLGDSQQLTS